MHTEEILDLVDSNDHVTGTISRTDAANQDISSIRVINVFLQNDEGQLWIPRRAATKRQFPNALGISVGGHVHAGESYEDALIREVQEEIHLDLHTIPYTPLGKLTPEVDGTHCFMQVYTVHTNETPSVFADEAQTSYWLFPHEIISMIEQGDTCMDDLPILVKRFFL
jgi:isopentenyldiphosphate isomerase